MISVLLIGIRYPMSSDGLKTMKIGVEKHTHMGNSDSAEKDTMDNWDSPRDEDDPFVHVSDDTAALRDAVDHLTQRLSNLEAHLDSVRPPSIPPHGTLVSLPTCVSERRAKQLAEHPVIPTSPDELFTCRGVTPLHHAAARGDVQECWRLLQMGIDVDVRDGEDSTPLTYSAWYGQLGTTKLLVESGADVFAISNNYGSCTAEEWARDGAYNTVADYLAQAMVESAGEGGLHGGKTSSSRKSRAGSWRLRVISCGSVTIAIGGRPSRTTS